MIYAINYNNAVLSGRVTLKGERSKVLTEYRMLTRAMCDCFGSDTVIQWTAGLAHDKAVDVQIDISPDQGGYYIPEGGAENE